MAYEFPEDNTDVRKHVGTPKDYMAVYDMCAFVWFYK